MERHLSKLKMSSKWHRVPIISNRMEIFVSKNAHYQLIIECKNRLKMIGRLDTVYEINNGLEDQE